MLNLFFQNERRHLNPALSLLAFGRSQNSLEKMKNVKSIQMRTGTRIQNYSIGMNEIPLLQCGIPVLKKVLEEHLKNKEPFYTV